MTDNDMQCDKHLSDQKIPEFLYKFRRWANAYDQLILTKQRVWFASPADFNDPFDCRIPFRYDLMSNEDLRCRLMERLREGHPDWDNARVESEVARAQDPLCQ